MKSSNLPIIGYVVLVMFGLLLLFGCLKDGVYIGGSDEFKLVVVPSADNIEAGDTVHFDIVLLGEIAEADLYINNAKISNSDYRFDEEGMYSVFAHKKGVKNSDTLHIVVGNGYALTKLNLGVVGIARNPATGVERYSFSVQAGDSVITDAEIYVDNEKISKYNYSFTPRDTSYYIYAHRAGYINSDTLEVIVEELHTQYILSPSDTEIVAGSEIVFSVSTLINGREQPATDVRIYINSALISGYQYVFDTAGSYEVVAKGFGGILDSDPVTILVKENTDLSNVYVVGFEGSGSSSKAILWRNSATDITILGAGVATDVFYFSGDIHVSGYLTDHSNEVYAAKYWKNGNLTTLTSGNSEAVANSVFVEDKDGVVYVGGRIDHAGYLWEDGNGWDLTGNYDPILTVNDLKFAEGQFWAVGNEVNDGKSKATIWGRGDRWGLYYDDVSYANAIELGVDGYYAAGRVGSKAVYWQDGTVHYPTTPAGLLSEAKDIVLKNGNIYLCGIFVSTTETRHAALWMNDKMIKLSGNGASGANAIAVAGDGSIYVGGWKASSSSGNRTAVYWKIDASGNILETVELTNGSKNAEATGIDLDQ